MPSEPLHPPDSPADPSRRPAFADFSFKESQSRKKRKRRHGHGMAEHSLWQFGAGVVPPAALVGMTLAVLAWIRPDILGSPVINASLLGLTALIIAGLGTILYGLAPGSSRLQRKDVWIALVSGVLTLLMVGATMLKPRLLPKTTPSPITPSSTADSSS